MATKAVLERRALTVATGCTALGFVMQLVAVCTDNWMILVFPDGTYRNKTGRYLMEAYMGLWRLCKVELNRTEPVPGKVVNIRHDICEGHNLFPTEEEMRANKAIDNQYLDFDPRELFHLDYTRTAIAFTIIAMILMIIGHMFAFYTLKRPRYIIKRLTALLHFMTAASLLVLNEVFSKTVDHERGSLPELPISAEPHYGFSFVLSWIVFVIYLGAGALFLFLSHKRKPEMADVEDEHAKEDAPMQLGRV